MDRMKLWYNSASPFARKVIVAAHELGLRERIELVPTDVWSNDKDIAAVNPLGKVPALETRDGIFAGSTLACEYLDSLHRGDRLVPQAPAQRWPVLQRHALADGIIEAAVAHVIERLRRPAQFVYPGMLARQRTKVSQTLALLETQVGALAGIDLSTITLGCALGYLDFRHDDLDWRTNCPGLASWYARFALRPSMQATSPSV